MLYINGIKATNKDISALNECLKKGTAQIIAIRRTPAGAIALTVEGG